MRITHPRPRIKITFLSNSVFTKWVFRVQLEKGRKEKEKKREGKGKKGGKSAFPTTRRSMSLWLCFRASHRPVYKCHNEGGGERGKKGARGEGRWERLVRLNKQPATELADYNAPCREGGKGQRKKKKRDREFSKRKRWRV